MFLLILVFADRWTWGEEGTDKESMQKTTEFCHIKPGKLLLEECGEDRCELAPWRPFPVAESIQSRVQKPFWLFRQTLGQTKQCLCSLCGFGDYPSYLKRHIVAYVINIINVFKTLPSYVYCCFLLLFLLSVCICV